METLSVRCNHCGAPLAVGTQTRFVTCQFCYSPLEVKRTDSAIFTEEVARMAGHAEKMAGSLEVIELQNEIERLDREWSTGQVVAPNHRGRPAGSRSPHNAAFGAAFSVFFAVVCFAMASAMRSAGGGFFVAVPIGMAVFALAGGLMGLVKSRSLDSSRRDYQRQRADLVARLDALRKPRT
jgi:hypothetical protein